MVHALAANAATGGPGDPAGMETYEDVICYAYLIPGLRTIDSDPTRPLCVTPSNKHQTSHWAFHYQT